MKIIHAPRELQSAGRKVCLAIGFFDGVHLGHQQIVRQTIGNARQHEAIALAITFDQHPNTIVAPDRVPPLIYSLPQKLRAMEGLGVDTLLLIHFDKQFSQQTGEEFIRGLARDLGALQSICVGANFVFGYKRGGNVELLKKLGEELKFTPAEYNLLTYFLQNPDRPLTRDMILNSVWGYESFPNTRTVDAHVEIRHQACSSSLHACSGSCSASPTNSP